jgi:PAS domain S-box-containing protein/putative nucleotidyltransferase with HDIG domain
MESPKSLEICYDLLFETAGDAILFMEGDRFIDCNHSALRMFGCTREQLLSVTPYAVSPPTQPDGQPSEAKALGKIEQAMAGAPQSFEWVHQRLDGTRFEVEVTLNSLELAGKPMLQAIVRDVTERKRLEKAVLAEQQKANDEMARLLAFETLLADISARLMGVSSQELKTEIPNAQRQICDLLGVDISSIYEPSSESAPRLKLTHLYRNHDSSTRPEALDAREFFPWCEQQVRAGKQVVIDAVRSLPPEANIDQGAFQYYGIQSSVVFPLVDRGSRILGTVSFGRVREERPWDEATIKRLRLAARIFAYTLSRQNAEASLRDSEARFLALSEISLVGIYMIQDGNLAYVNSAFAKMFGYEPAELVGCAPLMLIDPEDRTSAGQDMIKGPSGEVSENCNEFRARKKDGELRYFELFSAITVLNERPATIGNLLDVTERKLAEDEVRTAYNKLKLTLEDTVRTVSTIVEMRDPYTAGHQQRVANLAVAIGEELQLTPEVIERLRMVATLHDIGKIQIPAEILHRPGKLNPLERELIMRHPQSGYEIVKNMNFLPEVGHAIRQHHERLDGSGYPDGLKGEQIRLEARIVAVADVVETMASHRPYRPALGIDAALAEVSAHSGTFFDPQVVAACLKLFREKGFSFASPGARGEISPEAETKPPINLRTTL